SHFHAYVILFFFSSRRRHTRWPRDWSSDVCSSDLLNKALGQIMIPYPRRVRARCAAIPRGEVDRVTGDYWPASRHPYGCQEVCARLERNLRSWRGIHIGVRDKPLRRSVVTKTRERYEHSAFEQRQRRTL